MYERMKEKEEKEKRGVARKIWEGWIKWKKNKVQGRMSRCWETKHSLFFQPCAIRQRGCHRCLAVIFSFALAQVHHSKSSHPWYPYIWINSHDHWLWKGKQPLEEVLSLTILVLIALALPIATLYMLYERLMGGESFIKLV
jgi:hypothetical protein